MCDLLFNELRARSWMPQCEPMCTLHSVDVDIVRYGVVLDAYGVDQCVFLTIIFASF
jgi:hypothetical protein